MSKIIDKRKEYTEQIQSWDWLAIKKSCFNSLEIGESDETQLIGHCGLHSFRLTPSGKIYAPWTTNQRMRDVVLDALYQETLERIAETHGLGIEWNDEWLFAFVCVDMSDFNNETMGFLDNETETKFKEIITNE